MADTDPQVLAGGSAARGWTFAIGRDGRLRCLPPLRGGDKAADEATAAANAAEEAEAATAAAAAAAAAAAKKDGDDGPWDEERAKRTIAHLREKEREGAQAAARAKAAEAKLKKLEDADKSAAELATARAEEAERKLAEKDAELRKGRLLVELSKVEHGLVDAGAAAQLVGTVTYDDDGNPTGVAKLVEDLGAKYPFLKGTPTAPPPPKPGDVNAGGGNNAGDGPKLDADEVAAARAAGMSAEEYAHYKDPHAGAFKPADAGKE